MARRPKPIKRKKVGVGVRKAKQILKEGEIGGKKLTAKQKRFFGFLAGGGIPTRLKRKKAVKKRK